MKFLETSLPGVVVVDPIVFSDARGFFMETYHRDKFAEHGIEAEWVQDNHSASQHGTLRGLHYQIENPQAKLVRVIVGEIYDVAVDVRYGSPTFGKWYGQLLSAENRLQMYVPVGFAHGFCVTSERAEVIYKCTDLYNPKGERSVRWDDPDIGIDWPGENPLLSDKDAAAPRLADMDRKDLFVYEK